MIEMRSQAVWHYDLKVPSVDAGVKGHAAVARLLTVTHAKFNIRIVQRKQLRLTS